MIMHTSGLSFHIYNETNEQSSNRNIIVITNYQIGMTFSIFEFTHNNYRKRHCSNNSAGNSLQCKVVVINSTSLYPSFLDSNYTFTHLEGAARNT